MKVPDAFRTISEVADELDLPKHLLRFWEGKFSVLKPMKRGGGRRYYRPQEVNLLRGIRFLLYSEGYSLKGVQKILKDRGLRYVMECWVSREARNSDSLSRSDSGSTMIAGHLYEQGQRETDSYSSSPPLDSSKNLETLESFVQQNFRHAKDRTPIPAASCAGHKVLSDPDIERLQQILLSLREVRSMLTLI